VVQRDSACAADSIRAMRKQRPIDAIFVIDNSGSMDEEIAAVRKSINVDFAAIIGASGVDLRVIVISEYGVGGTSICVEPPLAGASCEAGLEATNSDRFFHYDQLIGSNDGLCYTLATFAYPDSAGRAPQGWQAWLRPEAAKAFVMITDDSAHCAYREEGGEEIAFGAGASPHEDALRFHQTLVAKAPEQFGSPPDTRYQFFSIVGMEGSGAAGGALLPHQPLSEQTCDTAPGAGLAYQALSVITDALRYPVCEGRSFDAAFQVVARSVLEASQDDCVFDLPADSERSTLDLNTVNLRFRPSGDSDVRQFVQVPSRAACADEYSFYIDDRIELCPRACASVKRDPAPEIEILYGCAILLL
jgi:hypothetical protein